MGTMKRSYFNQVIDFALFPSSMEDYGIGSSMILLHEIHMRCEIIKYSLCNFFPPTSLFKFSLLRFGVLTSSFHVIVTLSKFVYLYAPWDL